MNNTFTRLSNSLNGAKSGPHTRSKPYESGWYQRIQVSIDILVIPVVSLGPILCTSIYLLYPSYMVCKCVCVCVCVCVTRVMIYLVWGVSHWLDVEIHTVLSEEDSHDPKHLSACARPLETIPQMIPLAQRPASSTRLKHLPVVGLGRGPLNAVLCCIISGRIVLFTGHVLVHAFLCKPCP